MNEVLRRYGASGRSFEAAGVRSFVLDEGTGQPSCVCTESQRPGRRNRGKFVRLRAPVAGATSHQLMDLYRACDALECVRAERPRRDLVLDQ